MSWIPDSLSAQPGGFTVPLMGELAPTPLRVLVLDDDVDSSAWVAVLLTSRGHTVRQVATGAAYRDVGRPARQGVPIGRAGRHLPHRMAAAGQQHRDPGAAVHVVVQNQDAQRRRGQLSHPRHGEATRLCTRTVGNPAHRWVGGRVAVERHKASPRSSGRAHAQSPVTTGASLQCTCNAAPLAWKPPEQWPAAAPSRAARCHGCGIGYSRPPSDGYSRLPFDVRDGLRRWMANACCPSLACSRAPTTNGMVGSPGRAWWPSPNANWSLA